MASIDLEMRQIDNLFKNKGILLSCNNIWLKSCVECFRTQCNTYSSKELLDFVFEQWLLADLREVRSYSLPKECKTLEKFTILGKHAVQLNYTIDVGTSSYMQLQKIKKPNFGENLNIGSDRELGDQSHIEKNFTGRRAFKLEISDGQMTVIGFEYKPIPCLRNPVPGEKALLKGPIECRKGILLLTDKNIEILGGEVDTLLIPNAVSNVLARLLGQPEDPNPYKTHIESSQSDDVYSNCLEEDNDALIMLAEKVENSVATTQLSGTTSNSIPTSNSLTLNAESIEDLNFEDDDFDLIAAQTASLAEMQASSQVGQDMVLRRNKRAFTLVQTNEDITTVPQLTKTTATVSTSTNSPDIVEYVDMNDPKRLKKELEQSYGSGISYHKSHAEINTSSTMTGQSKNVSCQQNYAQTSCSSPALSHRKLEERIADRSFSSSLSSPVASQEVMHGLNQTNPKPLTPENSLNLREKSPTWMSKDFEEMDSQVSDSELISENNSEIFYQPYPPRNFPAIRVVRGQVVRLSEKLSLKNDKWCLSAVVSANGLELEMNFASEVLDKIFGVTATELIARRKDLKTNPAAKEQMNRLLRDSQLRIKNLKCEMVIRFPSVMAKPVIIDVIQK
uniref:RecQ-mediated genome instability protein 1 n=1 Tax=Triatoma infestans TaxID=30076 RepID=A0A023EX18_TRIIF